MAFKATLKCVLLLLLLFSLPKIYRLTLRQSCLYGVSWRIVTKTTTAECFHVKSSLHQSTTNVSYLKAWQIERKNVFVARARVCVLVWIYVFAGSCHDSRSVCLFRFFSSIFPTVSSQYFNVHFTIFIVSDTHYFKLQNAVEFVAVAVVVCRLL